MDSYESNEYDFDLALTKATPFISMFTVYNWFKYAFNKIILPQYVKKMFANLT